MNILESIAKTELASAASGLSLFRRMTALITVRDLARPLGPELVAGMTVEAAIDCLEQTAAAKQYDAVERISLVSMPDGTPRYTSISALFGTEHRYVGDTCTPASLDRFVTAHLDAQNAVALLIPEHPPFFFVLDGTAVIGTFSYSDLFSGPFKVCLFALTIELEEAALKLLLKDPTRCLHALPLERLAKAREVCARRFGEAHQQQDRDVIRSTTFIDKATMLNKAKLIPAMSKGKLQKLFARAEAIRNECAHPTAEVASPIPALSRDKLQNFLDQCHKLIADLSTLYCSN